MTAHESGYTTGYNGGSASDNPFPVDQDGPRQEWLRGFWQGANDADAGRDPAF